MSKEEKSVVLDWQWMTLIADIISQREANVPLPNLSDAFSDFVSQKWPQRDRSNRFETDIEEIQRICIPHCWSEDRWDRKVGLLDGESKTEVKKETEVGRSMSESDKDVCSGEEDTEDKAT